MAIDNIIIQGSTGIGKLLNIITSSISKFIGELGIIEWIIIIFLTIILVGVIMLKIKMDYYKKKQYNYNNRRRF